MVPSLKSSTVQELEVRFRKLEVRYFHTACFSPVMWGKERKDYIQYQPLRLKAILVLAQIQKPGSGKSGHGRYYPKELKREIFTEDLKQRSKEHNRQYRILRRMGRDGRKRALELWETNSRAWVSDLVEGAEKKGLVGLHCLEAWVKKLTERGKARETVNLIREELEKAYSRAFQPLML